MSAVEVQNSPPGRRLPEPSPPGGPDPYGNPDPEWLTLDWSAYRRTIEINVPPAYRNTNVPRASRNTNVPPASSASRPGAVGSAGGTTLVNYVEMAPAEQAQHAIVFVHGLSGCWQNWLEQIPYFGRTHRVIALDLPGFGDSPAPVWEVTIPSYGRLVLDLADALGVRDAAIVGHSLGGFVAAETAIAQPGRFEKLALVSAVGISSVQLRRRPLTAVARTLEAAAPLVFKAQTSTFRRPKARARAFEAAFAKPELIRPELLWEFFTGGERGESFVDALTSVAGYDIHDRLEEVDVPALVVWGRQDRIVPSRDAPEYARLLKHSRLEVFDGCGHIPMAEHPVRFNRVLEEFLRS